MSYLVEGSAPRAGFNGYVYDHEPRQHWAWTVRFSGKPICRCDDERDAEKIAKALNIAKAASVAAAEGVRK